jgi:phage host-nuclease inhibitor protein Gam
MAVKKKAAPIVTVPTTYEAANRVLEQYGEGARDLAKAEARLEKAVARLTARIEQTAKPLKERQAMLAAQIAAYAEANRATLLEDGRKSHDMPAGRIGWRTNPPSVKYGRGIKVEAIIAAILSMGLRRKFLRLKLEPNKEAMLEEENRAKARTIPGVSIITDAETFFIEPVTAQLSKGVP